MKISKVLALLFAGILSCSTVASQNVSINVLTQMSGIVKKGNTVFFEVTINNTDQSQFVGVYKLKAQISIADSTISIDKSGHQLPTGWEVIKNNDNTITVSNGKDIIAASDARTLLIALKGTSIGGPVMISGQLYFSNGISPGTEPGTLKGDNPADNYSTSSCKVIQ